MSEKNYQILETTIDKVVVFLDGARIYRSGSIELKKGYQQVKIVGLTKKLIKNSVRVSGKGKGSLGAIDVETQYQEMTSHEELNKLLLEEKKLKKDLQVLQEKYDFVLHQNNQMKILSEKFSSEFPQWYASGETNITTLTDFKTYEGKVNVDYLKEKQKLEDEKEELNKKLTTLQAKINEYRNPSQVEQTTNIVIGVDATQAGPFSFELSYQAKDVNWEPSYDVDLKKDSAVLKGMAQVVNRTLEDWKDVSLTISTAVFKPIRVIEPNPFYIDIYSPRPPPAPGRYALASAPMKMKKMEAKEAVMDERKAYPTEEDYEEAPLMEPEATITESPAGVQSYEIPGKWSIPSDGNVHPVTLTTQDLKTSKEFYWNAIDSLGVIAQDKITNGDAIILAGNAKVYSEGEFIGETYINKVSPREEFKLGAREELKMKAEKKLLSRVKEKAGLVKGKRSVDYEYELNIKNFRKEESFITIKDVIPYSRSERIKVKDFASSIPSVKDNLGIYTWEIKIPVDKETKITYTYNVEWEKDYDISPPLP
ncbi:MAG: mucoidy inhibitor MuiA family protein [Candidatus Thorarchaeota archaeon]